MKSRFVYILYIALLFLSYDIRTQPVSIEKYTFLASQPVKDAELVKSLNDTKQTLEDIVELIEDDLRNMIDKDIDTLQFELEVAKKSIDRKR